MAVNIYTHFKVVGQSQVEGQISGTELLTLLLKSRFVAEITTKLKMAKAKKPTPKNLIYYAAN